MVTPKIGSPSCTAAPGGQATPPRARCRANSAGAGRCPPAGRSCTAWLPPFVPPPERGRGGLGTRSMGAAARCSLARPDHGAVFALGWRKGGGVGTGAGFAESVDATNVGGGVRPLWGPPLSRLAACDCEAPRKSHGGGMVRSRVTIARQ